jgi:hypothetical protein
MSICAAWLNFAFTDYSQTFSKKVNLPLYSLPESNKFSFVNDFTAFDVRQQQNG